VERYGSKWNKRSLTHCAKLKNEIQQLLDITQKLRNQYGLGFPLDGRLVGDIGEALAQEEFNINLLPPNTPLYDAKEIDTGRMIQIKSSMNYFFSLPFNHTPEFYLALHINSNGSLETVYNGPGQPLRDYVLESGIKPYSTNWYVLSLGKLKSLSIRVDESLKIKLRQ